VRGWRRWTLLLWLLIFPTLPMWSESSPTASESSTIYSSADELADEQDEAEAREILRRTVERAVAVAVTPLEAKIAGLEVRGDMWERAAREQAAATLAAEARVAGLQALAVGLGVGVLAALTTGLVVGHVVP
jgi:hypothetical protein